MRYAPNKLWLGSISTRIAFLFSATFAVGLVIAFIFTYLELRYSLENSSKEVIEAKHRETSAVLTTKGIHGLRKFLSEDRNKILNAPYLIRIIDESGATIFLKPSVQSKSFDFEDAFRLQRDPSEFVGWHAISAIGDEDKFDLLTEKVSEALYLQVGTSSEDREHILEQILSGFGVMAATLIFLSGALGMWYSRKTLAPVRELIAAIRGIERGDLGKRVNVGRAKDELQDLAETFNGMIARIERLVQVMRESLDNLAHDIRTPLSRILAVSEDALLSSDPSVRQSALEDCAEVSVGISELVAQLLSISEAQAGTLSFRFEECPVRKLLVDVADIYEFVAHEKVISIHVEGDDESLVWNLDRKRVKQVVGNLIDNAIKFSPDKTTVTIRYSVDEGRLKISVADQGIGIATGDLDRIWDRLYRGDKSRSTKGLGLGLSIVRSIVCAHGGDVRAFSLTSGGMEFVVILPSNPSESPVNLRPM